MTFGRYTGETPYKLADMSPEDRSEVSPTTNAPPERRFVGIHPMCC